MYPVTLLLPLAAVTTFSQVLAIAVPPTSGPINVGQQVSSTWGPWGPNGVGKQVNTTSGLVTGHPASGYPSLSEYLGIPFAEAPVGGLRFAPPNPYTDKGPITANTQPLSCPQLPSSYNYSLPQPAQYILGNSGSFANNTSEDCLFLNVWAPSSDTSTALKPVMIWIFGGGYHGGGASDASEQLALFAEEQDLVMVNFNYRLGIFGFPGASGLQQNLGLLDQRLAVEWCRWSEYGSVQYAWKDDPIIVGSIIMSGTSTSFGHRTPATAVNAWDTTSQIVGCGESNTTSSAVVLSCMLQKSTEQIFNASLQAADQVVASLSTVDQGYIGVTGIYSPTTDDVTVFANYSILGQQGQFTKLPILTENNNDEACLFTERGQFPVSDDPLVNEGIFTCPINWDATYRT